MVEMVMSTEDAVRRLAVEHSEWLAVLQATTAVAAAAEEHGGEFPGKWVVDELRSRGLTPWIPGLRIFVTFGLLEKSGPTTRGGKRAYYRMPNRLAIEEALRARLDVPSPKRRTLSFVASGSSDEPPTDLARRSGDLVFEPRSWR
jgi:hypothetical protein